MYQLFIVIKKNEVRFIIERILMQNFVSIDFETDMTELTPGYYRHFKDAVAPMKRGNPSGMGKVPSGRKPLSHFIGRRFGVRPALDRLS